MGYFTEFSVYIQEISINLSKAVINTDVTPLLFLKPKFSKSLIYGFNVKLRIHERNIELFTLFLIPLTAVGIFGAYLSVFLTGSNFQIESPIFHTVHINMVI